MEREVCHCLHAELGVQIGCLESPSGLLISNKAPQAPANPPASSYPGTGALAEDPRVAQSKVQYQEGFSLSEFIEAYGTERSASRPWSMPDGPRASAASGVGRVRTSA